MTKRFGALAFALVVALAIVVPWLSPYDHDAIDLSSIKDPPRATHWMGTDELGRDVATRVLTGTRLSLVIGLFGALVATSIGAGLGALAALVVNLASGERYSASRGGGAYRDGRAIRPSAVGDLADAIIGLSGWSPRRPRWRQYRALGAAALDLCAVADGRLDGFVDCHSHGPWDYLGGMLVCREAGAQVVDAEGRDLTTTDPRARRTLLAAGNHSLLADLRGPWAG